MIGFLKGSILDKKPTKILIDVNGVGYIVHISLNTFDKLPAEGSQISLFTYLNVREDALDLFGFINPDEKEMFLLLISVNGIGAKLALNILSGIQTNELHEALKTGNLSRITAVPGIGRKTGERMIVELRDKVDSLAERVESLSFGTSSSVKNDAIGALTSLGYNQKTAEKAVSQVLAGNHSATIEDVIRLALGYLNK
jgi:holliday junction DNA helicase RuvA